MVHWKRQPHISTFQRSFIEGTTFELQQWLLERARAAGAELLDPPIYTLHTWLEEMRTGYKRSIVRMPRLGSGGGGGGIYPIIVSDASQLWRQCRIVMVR